ncbi:hypothetical protein G9A89_018629 [Geosiphon pyriformis]|nr:hypothetical protein G9A89_018629 [Geosiphon pyriformis]
MTVLQRELFRTSVVLVGVRVSANSTAKFLKILKDDLFNQPKMKNVAEEPGSKTTRIILLKPEIQSLELFDENISKDSRDLINKEGLGFVKHIVDLDYGYWGADDILKAILPEGGEIPSSFTQVGHIAHMNLREEFIPWKNIIGQVILDKNSKITTVVNKTDSIDTTFRFFKMEVLAGIDNMITEVKEGNCKFRLDFSQVYWNSRLHSEHERLVNLFKKGEYICDVFAGVGPFAVPAAKKGCIVYANDLNPVSYKYLKENSELNKVQNRIIPYNLDGREFIRKIVNDLKIASETSTYHYNESSTDDDDNKRKNVKREKSTTPNENKTESISNPNPEDPSTEIQKTPIKFRTFDHFVMNLPAMAIEFLDMFKGLYRDMQSLFDSSAINLPMIHCHCFSKSVTPETELIERIKTIFGDEASNISTDAFKVQFVRSVAPNKDMYCVSFRLDSAIAFSTPYTGDEHERKKRKLDTDLTENSDQAWYTQISTLENVSTSKSSVISENVSLYRNKWEVIIGLEIHAQINSKTKLFSSSSTSFNQPINTNVSLFDAAFPGTIPRLNAKCVELAVSTSIALSCKVQPISSFDRKHYFYPDQPAGYQITQHYAPLALDGKLSLSFLDGLEYDKIIRIKQLHLEQDTGKSIQHAGLGGYPVAFIDLNRAGIGLMEIVTEPDIRSSQEAGIVLRKLQVLLRTIGSSNGNMEEGSLRCDLNVSVHELGAPFGTRCEVKNLNSIKFLMAATDVEIERQVSSLENGIPIGPETRGFDVARGKTFRLRTKETSTDYRYMPEPDLPNLILTEEYISKLVKCLPELPDAKKRRLMKDYNISLHDARVLMNELGGVEYFELISQNRDPRMVVNWITHELFGELAKRKKIFSENPVTAEQLGSIVDSIKQNIISGKIGKQVLPLMIDGDKRLAHEIVEEKKWRQITDINELQIVCEKVIAHNPKEIVKIQKGNFNITKWFVGQVMRETKGQANPQLVNEVLKKCINEAIELLENKS